jgi:hypothetical protein
MRLTGNKKEISYNKVYDNIYFKEKNILVSDWDIWNKRDMDIRTVTNSNHLKVNIYNEVNRE